MEQLSDVFWRKFAHKSFKESHIVLCDIFETMVCQSRKSVQHIEDDSLFWNASTTQLANWLNDLSPEDQNYCRVLMIAILNDEEYDYDDMNLGSDGNWDVF